MKLNLTEEQKKAALEAGKQGMKNAYEKSKYRPGLTWWERLLWVVLAGAAYAASSLLSGCGHTIDVTAERTEICRDGACLVLEPGRLSYSQAQPETEVQPVIQRIRAVRSATCRDKRFCMSRPGGNCGSEWPVAKGGWHERFISRRRLLSGCGQEGRRDG